MFKKILVAFIFFCTSAPSFAQNYEKEFETIFAWEVKQIDEFIERFNNKDKTLIRNYAQKTNNPAKDFSRERMLKSLFDAQKKTWNFDDINAFIKDARDENVRLSFYDQNWYAKVNCSVNWNGSPQKASLILKLVVMPDSASKWVISGVTAPFLKSTTLRNLSIPEPRDKQSSLNPVSHATDFMNIGRVTENIVNIQNYFSPFELQNEETKIFMQECIAKRLVINGVSNISYHFLQVNNWIFELNQFNRQTNNSGWLISKLVRASKEDKDLYAVKVLKQ
jgi:hypothetical protein